MANAAWFPAQWIFHSVAVGTPWLGAVVLTGWRREPRIAGFITSLVALLASLLLLLSVPRGESLNQALMVLFSCVTLAATLLLPKRDCNVSTIGGVLLLLGATLLTYSSDNLIVFFAGWVLSIVPFLLRSWFRTVSWRPATALLLSTVALALAFALMSGSAHSFRIDTLKARSPGGNTALGLLVIAVIVRKGLLPAHAWIADAMEGGPAMPTALLLNGHYGAVLVAKLILPLYPFTTGKFFPLLSWFAMATAAYMAIRALTQNAPRQLLSSIALSQSACILAGLESRTSEGISGAVVHWFVVTVSITGLFGILRLLEVRFGQNLTASTHLGLAPHAPRLAVFFAIFGLTLVGLPGTLSFWSQDLLIHGTLMSHPVTGVVLPIATAMNATSVFRLFVRLFLGKRRTGFTHIADALPRERWALAAGVLFVVAGGLFPSALVTLQSGQAGIADQIHDAVPPQLISVQAPNAVNRK